MSEDEKPVDWKSLTEQQRDEWRRFAESLSRATGAKAPDPWSDLTVWTIADLLEALIVVTPAAHRQPAIVTGSGPDYSERLRALKAEINRRLG